MRSATAIIRLALYASVCLLVTMRVAAAGCLDDVQQAARDYRLPPSLTESNSSNSIAAPSGESRDAPVTDESRGVTAGPDTLTNSGGTAPPPETKRSGPAVELGATDRAKVEGLLAQARAAAIQGHSDQCAKLLEEARSTAQADRD